MIDGDTAAEAVRGTATTEGIRAGTPGMPGSSACRLKIPAEHTGDPRRPPSTESNDSAMHTSPGMRLGQIGPGALRSRRGRSNVWVESSGWSPSPEQSVGKDLRTVTFAVQRRVRRSVYRPEADQGGGPELSGTAGRGFQSASGPPDRGLRPVTALSRTSGRWFATASGHTSEPRR